MNSFLLTALVMALPTFLVVREMINAHRAQQARKNQDII